MSATAPQVDWANAFGAKPVRRHYIDFEVFWNATPDERSAETRLLRQLLEIPRYDLPR